MNIKIINEYLRKCKMNKIEPTWQGLITFNKFKSGGYNGGR